MIWGESGLEDVIKIAFQAHSGQVRDDGEPYIIHPVSVALILVQHGFGDNDHLMSALLHDVVEDTKFTISDLAGYVNYRSLIAIELLTKRKNQTYKDYYNSIQHSVIAMHVKQADRIHNLRSMEGVWTRKKCLKYIQNTEKDFEGWGFSGSLGIELKETIEKQGD